MQWSKTTIDKKFIISVVTGINVGDGHRYVDIVLSSSTGELNIAKTSNIGVPGVWILKVDSGIGIIYSSCEMKGDCFNHDTES